MFFFKKYKIKVILKSGETIVFRCDNLKVTKNGNELTGWEVEGNSSFLYIRLADISAIIKH